MLYKDESHFRAGHAFETYVVNVLFPRASYVVKQITPRRDDLQGRYIANSQNPDVEIQHMRSGHSFYVECKWRTSKSIINRKLAICRRDQLERYREFQEKVRPEKVYVVVGLNGAPDGPSRLYCIPLEELVQPWMYLTLLKPFERPPGRPFEYWYGRLR